MISFQRVRQKEKNIYIHITHIIPDATLIVEACLGYFRIRDTDIFLFRDMGYFNI